MIAAQPGASSREVADAAGVSDDGQISKLLARLQSLGLIRDPGQRRVGEPHSWRLTAAGRRAIKASAAGSHRPAD